MKANYLNVVGFFIITILDCMVYALALLFIVEFYKYDFNYTLTLIELSKANIDMFLNYYTKIFIGVILFMGVLKYFLKYKCISNEQN